FGRQHPLQILRIRRAPMAESASKARHKKPTSLDAAVNSFAAQKIRKLDRQKVLDGLHKAGIRDLETLVSSAVSSISELDPEALICFPYYIYRRHDPLFQEELEADLRQFEQFATRQIGE